MNENNVHGKSFKTYLSDTDSSSTHSSCECNDVNSIVSDFEWENEINDQGELFYVKCSPRKQIKYTKHNTIESNDAPKKTKTTAGKLVKLLKRKKRGRDRNDGSKHTGNSNKVTFLDTQEGEVREVTVEVENDSYSNLGRRATLTEKLLGLSTTVFEDGSRIMVASIIPNTPVDNQRSIKIGDWLKIINGEIVTAKTLDQILSNITPPTTVTLVVQRVAVSLVGVDKHNNQQLSSYLSLKTINDEFVSELAKYPVAVMYLKSENSNAIYVYPGSSSIFNQIKGAFQTISHIVPQIVQNQTRSISMILCDDQLVHSIFLFEGQGTFIFIAPDSKLNLTYADWMASHIVRNLCFCYENLNSCFSNEDNHCSLDKYFTIIFSELYDINMFHNIENSYAFEKYLPASKSIPLLRSIQMELDDILNEFEANYVYKDTREPRPYLIIGTSIYYKEYLLSSHLKYEDHLDVHMFCLQNGLFHLLNSEYLERLIIFRRVYPSSVRSNSTFVGSVYTLPKAKWYLLIVGRGNNLMATLLEVGPCCLKNEVFDGPNVEYVEEAEDTLESVLNMNVDEVAEKWIEGNMQIYQTESLKNAGVNMLVNNKQSSGFQLKKPEIISILKHKNDITSNSQLFNDSRQLDSCSETSLTSSGAPSTEDSIYVQGPVFGRRAERMMKASSIEWSDNSEDEYTVSDGSRSIDMTDVIKNLPVLPNKFGLGKLSMLFRYLDIHCHTGVMLCSPSIYDEYNLKTKDIFKNIDEKFNSSVTIIRDLFDDSNQDENEINEIGVLFQIPTSNTDSPKKSSMIRFWVMGRLFKEPNKRELYVCYEEGIPQNMIEIAFKLGTNYATG